jgi:thiamine-phosphate pyrophosphorylase
MTDFADYKPINFSVNRILDANLDRAREGLRIVEEWCRFGLNNASLTNDCKEMRRELAKWHSADLRMARNTPEDVGTALSHPQEEIRDNIESVLQANLCRIQEALRVLEEYGKLYHPDMGVTFKQLRYRVYTLESNLMGYSRHQKLQGAYLYLVTSSGENLLPVVESALQGGLTLVQYREKNLDDGVRLAYAQQLCQLCHQYNALFIVNDRIDLALAVNGDGVHLGQQDLPVAIARELLGSQKIIGKSTTNPEEMSKAIAEGADYVGVGPIYETPTKPGKKAAGYNYLAHAVAHCPIPWFAIGGIDHHNINDVLNGGAQRVAVVRAIMEADQPDLMTQYFLSQLLRRRHVKVLPEKIAE